MTQRPESKNTGELKCIAYLRGLAALGVVIFHVRMYLWVGFDAMRSDPSLGDPLARAVMWLSFPAPFLGSGVMLFFVISGFCIHFPYASPRGRRFVASEYTIRRFCRIYPPYLVAVLFSLAVEYWCVLIGKLHSVNWPLNGLAALMLQNWTGKQPACDPAFWTLPVEVEFYILFPLIYWGLKSFSIFWTIVVSGIVTLISTVLLAEKVPLIDAHFSLYWLMWVGGAALAEFYQRNRLSSPPWWVMALSLLSLGIALFAQRLPDASAGFFWVLLKASENLTYGLFFLVLVWWSICHQDWYGRLPVLLIGFLGLLGDISYSLYLIHMPLFEICSDLWVRYFGQKPVNFIVSLLFCFVAIGVAKILYRLVEEPSHHLGRSMARSLSGSRPKQ